jgi:hypothetical protein
VEVDGIDSSVMGLSSIISAQDSGADTGSVWGSLTVGAV